MLGFAIRATATLLGVGALLLIGHLDFVSHATLYLADPSDPDVLWRYQPGWGPANPARFERIFPTRSEERAARRSLDGDAGALDAVNTRKGFLWLGAVGDAAAPRAVVSIEADASKDFRKYLLSP